MDWTQLNDIIKSSKNILIISHINPDGDTLGSMCGLYSAIVDNFRKKSDMLLMSKCPEKYSFLQCYRRHGNLRYYEIHQV